MRLDVDKRTDNTEPRSICFLPQYAKLKKIFILAHDRDSGTKKQQALSITLSQSDWFISQNERFNTSSIYSSRQRQISQSNCEIISNSGLTLYWKRMEQF